MKNRNVTFCPCGKELPRANQKFCSNACRQKSYRQKLKTTSDNEIDQICDQLLETAKQKGVSEQDLFLEILYRDIKDKLQNLPRIKRHSFICRLLEEMLKEP